MIVKKNTINTEAQSSIHGFNQIINKEMNKYEQKTHSYPSRPTIRRKRARLTKNLILQCHPLLQFFELGILIRQNLGLC